MQVYKIHVQHFSQKDSHSSIETFLLAESVEDVYKWVDEKAYGLYTDRTNDNGLIDIQDEDYNVIGQETFKEKMIRIGGEFFDDDYEPQDLYYGCTIYGWERLDFVKTNEVKTLERLGLLIKV